MRFLVLVGLMVAPALAQAADGPWTPAPTPRVGDPAVLPTARVGRGADPNTVAAPFSSAPLGSITTNGATSSNKVNGVQTPDLSGQ